MCVPGLYTHTCTHTCMESLLPLTSRKKQLQPSIQRTVNVQQLLHILWGLFSCNRPWLPIPAFFFCGSALSVFLFSTGLILEMEPILGFRQHKQKQANKQSHSCMRICREDFGAESRGIWRAYGGPVSAMGCSCPWRIMVVGCLGGTVDHWFQLRS